MSDWKKRNEDWRDEDELLYAHTQDKPRLELTEKIEADFYTPVSYTHLTLPTTPYV